MARLRSFTITFSQVSCELNGLSASARSSANPAVFSFWLWHETQYLFVSSRAGLSVAAVAATAEIAKPVRARHQIFVIAPLCTYSAPRKDGPVLDRRHASAAVLRLPCYKGPRPAGRHYRLLQDTASRPLC